MNEETDERLELSNDVKNNIAQYHKKDIFEIELMICARKLSILSECRHEGFYGSMNIGLGVGDYWGYLEYEKKGHIYSIDIYIGEGYSTYTPVDGVLRSGIEKEEEQQHRIIAGKILSLSPEAMALLI